MRTLLRRTQYIWLTTSSKSDESIEAVTSYSKPVKVRVAVSNASGTPREIAAGLAMEYSRYFISFDRDFDAEEGTLVYVDRIPEIDVEGELVLDEEGDPTVAPDYVITHIWDSQRGTIARYGIRKIAGNG